MAPIIDHWLADDAGAPRKQRHTAKRIYDRLVAEHGFRGTEGTVRRYVRLQRAASVREVTLPLAHDAGQEAQIDFGEATVRIAGVLTVVQLFCARLAFSTRDFVRAYSRQDRAAWLDGHVHAFETWQGAPAWCVYDNPSTLGRRQHQQFIACDEFLALQSAYRFRARHCTPAEGHEKGLVEGLVGYFRRTYLVPLPEVADLEELNAYLAGRAGDEERCRRRDQTLTVGERFAQEQPLLAPLPEHPFLPCTRHPVTASMQALVRFERRPYSMPVEHAGCKLWLRAFAEHVEIWSATRCVARHPRRPGPGEPITDFWHYLPVLRRKPGAFEQAIPVRQAQFPEEARALLGALEARHGDDRRRAHREFLAICAQHRDVESVRWRAACATALARGEVSAAGVRSALAGTVTRPLLAPVQVLLPLPLAEVRVPAGDPSLYSRLLVANR